MTTSFEHEPAKKIIVRIDPEIAEIVPTFLGNTNRNIELMRSALEANDLNSVGQSAHKLKGAANLYGFITLSEYAGSLEQAAMNKDTESACQWMTKIILCMAQIEIKYE